MGTGYDGIQPGVLKNDFWAYVTESNPSGVDDNALSFACSAFPNPCTAYLTLQMDDSGNEVKNITVTDTQGRMIYKSKSESTRLNLDVRGWANGTYVFRIQNAKGQERTILINKL